MSPYLAILPENFGTGQTAKVKMVALFWDFFLANPGFRPGARVGQVEYEGLFRAYAGKSLIYMAVWRSGGLAVWRSGCLAVWLSGGLAVWRSGGLAVWRSGGLAVWRSGGMIDENLSGGYGSTCWERAGHDLWLTIAGHGAGFWDGDWPLNGDLLTQWCRTYQYKIEPYIGYDGKVYFMGDMN